MIKVRAKDNCLLDQIDVYEPEEIIRTCQLIVLNDGEIKEDGITVSPAEAIARSIEHSTYRHGPVEIVNTSTYTRGARIRMGGYEAKMALKKGPARI